MIFRQLFDLESSTYTYLLADETSREAIFIDPVLGQMFTYQALLSQLGLTLKLALDTHVHADHVTALGKLHELTGCQSMPGRESQVPCASALFQDGQVLSAGSIELTALFTPGHTSDSYCFYLPDLGMVFTGDTLLIRGTGRTDFQNGDAATQYRSLKHKLLTLPADTRVYPGHDYKGWTVSTIAEEIAHNSRLQVADQAAYVELMAGLKLPDPRQMDLAIPANRACGGAPAARAEAQNG